MYRVLRDLRRRKIERKSRTFGEGGLLRVSSSLSMLSIEETFARFTARSLAQPMPVAAGGSPMNPALGDRY